MTENPKYVSYDELLKIVKQLKKITDDTEDEKLKLDTEMKFQEVANYCNLRTEEIPYDLRFEIAKSVAENSDVDKKVLNKYRKVYRN